MATQYKAQSSNQLLMALKDPARVYASKDTTVVLPLTKTDVFVGVDASTDTSIFKSEYSFLGMDTKTAELGHILAQPDFSVTFASETLSSDSKIDNDINSYLSRGKETMIPKKRTYSPRQNGNVLLTSNFELRQAAPMDARTVAPYLTCLSDANWWLGQGAGSAYLYSGLMVSLSGTGDVYCYNGPDIEIKSDNATIREAIKSANWIKINNCPTSIQDNSTVTISKGWNTSSYTDDIIISKSEDGTALALVMGKDHVFLGNHDGENNKTFVVNGNGWIDDYVGLYINGKAKAGYNDDSIVLTSNKGSVVLSKRAAADASGNVKSMSKVELDDNRILLQVCYTESGNYFTFRDMYIGFNEFNIPQPRTAFGAEDWIYLIDQKNKEVIYRSSFDPDSESDNYDEYNHVRMSPNTFTVDMSHSKGGAAINLLGPTIRLWEDKIKFNKPDTDYMIPIYQNGGIEWIGYKHESASENKSVFKPSETDTSTYGTMPCFAKVGTVVIPYIGRKQYRLGNTNSVTTYTPMVIASPSCNFKVSVPGLYSLDADLIISSYGNYTEGTSTSNVLHPQSTVKPAISTILRINEYDHTPNQADSKMSFEAEYADDVSDKPDTSLKLPIGLKLEKVTMRWLGTGQMNRLQQDWVIGVYAYIPGGEYEETRDEETGEIVDVYKETFKVNYEMTPTSGEWYDAATKNKNISGALPACVYRTKLIENNNTTATTWAMSYDAILKIAAQGPAATRSGLSGSVQYTPKYGQTFVQYLNHSKKENTQLGKNTTLKKLPVYKYNLDTSTMFYSIDVDDLNNSDDLKDLVTNNTAADTLSVLYYMIA